MEELILDKKMSDLTLGEVLELNSKPSEINGNQALADYIGYSLRTVNQWKSEGVLDGTFRQFRRKVIYNRKKIDKLFEIK